MARWVFVLSLLTYLLGPTRAVELVPGGRAVPIGVAAVAHPVTDVLDAVYPQVEAPDRGRWMVRVVTSLCSAGALALLALTLRRLAPAETSLVLTFLTGFASPLWSWTSRCDVPGSVATLGVGIGLWLALGRSAGSARLASPLDRGVAGLAGLLVLAFAAHAMGTGEHGSFRPSVAAAYLVSPGRGLLFFAPVSLLALLAIAMRRGTPALIWGCAGLSSLAGIEIASRAEPWGPLGFGPTLLVPYVPLIAVIACSLPRNWLRTGALMSLPAVLAHGAAVFMGGHTWDERRQVAQNPEAVWDFADSPFTDLLLGPPRPDPAGFAAADYLMRTGDHITREGHPLQWLVYGWEKAEVRGVWSSGRESWIVIAAPPGDYVLTLIASGPRRRGQSQRALVDRPVQPPLELSFSKELWELEPLSIPFRAEHNISVLKLRPAHTWMPGHGDVRRCGIFLAALRLKETPVP